MGRPLRATTGGLVYHVLNRANGRRRIFDDPSDYEAFERILADAAVRTRIRLVSYCIMPNHWHLVLWPAQDDQLSRFTGWLTLTHTQRWHAHRHTAGEGHLYQGRFKSFPVQTDHHFLTVCRYVERNPLRAGLVRRVEQWRWSSLSQRQLAPSARTVPLVDGPVDWPRDWLRLVQAPQNSDEEDALRHCIRRGRPFGSGVWLARVVSRLGLEITLRPRGRPQKQPAKAENGS